MGVGIPLAISAPLGSYFLDELGDVAVDCG